MTTTTTETLTQVGVRLQMVSLEMQSLNDRSVKDALLGSVLAYGVPRRYVQSFTLWGMVGDHAHARLTMDLNYEEHDHQVAAYGDNLPDGLAGKYSLGCGVPPRDGQGPSRPPTCPHMGKALELYMRLIKDKGLRLVWTVSFREKDAEMCAKFGLVPVVIQDCTTTGVPNYLTNSRYAELTMMARASTEALPAQ